jgi:hypothetical protein
MVYISRDIFTNVGISPQIWDIFTKVIYFILNNIYLIIYTLLNIPVKDSFANL